MFVPPSLRTADGFLDFFFFFLWNGFRPHSFRGGFLIRIDTQSAFCLRLQHNYMK